MESKADMLSRVCLMAEGSETWDLSDNDTRALRHALAERNEFKQSSELSALRIRELEAELAEARLDRARLQTALKAAMVVLSGQETSKAMLIRALELGRLAIKEAK